MSKQSAVQAKAGSAPGLTRSSISLLERSTLGSHICMRPEAADPTVHPPASSLVRDVVDLPGRPLDGATRSFMEPRFGHDFSRVRVHTDAQAAASARAVNALAYTVGRHIVFGAGQHNPKSNHGRFILAHELAHVVQQSRAVNTPDIAASEMASYEHEADTSAWSVVSGQQLEVHARLSRPCLQKIDLTPENLSKDDVDPKTATTSDDYLDNNINDAGLRQEGGEGWKPNFVALTIKYRDGSILDIPLKYLQTPTPPGSMKIVRYRAHAASGKIVPVTWRGTPAELANAPGSLPEGSVIFTKDITPNIMAAYDLALFRRAAAFSGELAAIWGAVLAVRGAIQIFSAVQSAAISAAGRGALGAGGVAARAAAVRKAQQQALEAEQKALIAELRAAGAKFTEKEIISVIRSAGGKVVWLEKGSAQRGLEHIIQRHAGDFARLGVKTTDEIVNLIIETLKTKLPVRVIRDGSVFKVVMGGAEREMNIVVGSNGFIVTAYPL